MSIDQETTKERMSPERIARRKRANRHLRYLSWGWLPLSVVYASWLAVMGYELAKWAGALFVPLLGFGYSFIIAVSLEARSTRPFPISEEQTSNHTSLIPTERNPERIPEEHVEET